VCSNGAVDGVHDLGGMQGFGPVDVEEDESVFHADWERRAFRMTIASMMAGHLSGRFRHAIERMDPAWYLASPYYEHWLTATATGLVEAGLFAHADLDERLGAPYPVARPIRATRLTDPGPSSSEPRFAPGDRVRVREWHPLGHTRAPRYAQGKRGRVVRLDGVFSLPDVEYHCDERRMEPTYSVRFEALELWGEPGDPVHVDLWESYLQPDQG
jgi:nitrile hydratase subunit beta